MVCNKRNCRYLFQKIQNTAQVLKINETEINTENAFSWDRLGIGGDNKSDFGDDNEKWNFKPQLRHIWDALRDLVLLYNLRNVKNIHGALLLLVIKVTLLHGCFSYFLNCTTGTKSRKAPHVFQRTIYF